MIRIEIYAVLKGERFIVETEESMGCKRFAEGLRILLSEEDRGILMNCDPVGIIPEEGALMDYGIRSGALLLFIGGTIMRSII